MSLPQVETVGDAYVVACGLMPEVRDDEDPSVIASWQHMVVNNPGFMLFAAVRLIFSWYPLAQFSVVDGQKTEKEHVALEFQMEFRYFIVWECQGHDIFACCGSLASSSCHHHCVSARTWRHGCVGFHVEPLGGQTCPKWICPEKRKQMLRSTHQPEDQDEWRSCCKLEMPALSQS